MNNSIRYILLAIFLLALSAQYAIADIPVENADIDDPYAKLYSVNTRANSELSFQSIDLLLQHIVTNFGPSDRVSMSSPNVYGMRVMTTGHQGPAALEGNRIAFSRFTKNLKISITNYRKNLEKIGTEMNVDDLSLQQQLAYWYNLHNIAVIEQIALHYPVKYPENIRYGRPPVKFDDAKTLNIKGIPLSLRDIRTKIVYKLWQNPLAIYGFFHGSVGGPSIQTQAYTEDNVVEMLEDNAIEFVNSLRGVRKFGNKVYVSRFYREAEVLFPDWQKDLKTHLLNYAEPMVQGELDNYYALVVKEKFKRVADLIGGRLNNKVGRGIGSTEPGAILRAAMMKARAKKNYRIFRRNRARTKQPVDRERIVIIGEDRDAGDNATSETDDMDNKKSERR